MALPDRIRLVVLYGGRSAEHDVSCVTAGAVLRAVDHRRYDVVPVGIGRDGTWSLSAATIAAIGSGAGADGVLDPAALPDRLSTEGDVVEPTAIVAPADATPVVVLPLLHGPYGEDGTVQGLLEMADLPYVGSGVLASSVAMDKGAAKELLAFHGIAQCAWETLHITDADEQALGRVADRLGFPIFVKPANMGSSVGVSKARDAAELAAAVAEAARFDEWIVCEEQVVGRELECAVLGNDRPRASVIGEIRPGGDFYDYDDKYVDGTAELLIPAPLPHPVADEMRALALRAYRALRCTGMARVDCFYEADGRGFLVNEVNTIPGFTPISMYPKLWEASGLGYGRLIDELVALAIERHARRSGFATDR